MGVSLLKFAGSGLLVYAALVAIVALAQRRLIYFPSHEYPVTPADFGLPYEEHVLTAADGVRLAAWWVPAESAVAPVVLCFHGNATNISGMIGHAAVFKARGFACLLAEYRGYGRSSGYPTEEGVYRDASAAYHWLMSRGVSPQRLMLYGHSLGAAVAAWLAAEQATAGTVLEGSFPSIHAMARHHYWWMYAPEAVIQDKFPTARHVARARCPVLVVHGEDDEVAPFKFGQAVFAAASPPKTFCAVPGAAHNTLGLEFPEGAAAFDRFVADCLSTVDPPLLSPSPPKGG